MTIKSLLTNNSIELDFEAIADWQDLSPTLEVKTPSGPDWIDAYLLRLARSEVR